MFNQPVEWDKILKKFVLASRLRLSRRLKMINWDHSFNCSTMHEKIHSEMKWSLTTGFECMFYPKIEKNFQCNNTPSEYTRLYEKIQNAMFTKYTRLAHHKTQFKLNFRIAIKFAQIHQNLVKQSIYYVQLFKLPKIEIKIVIHQWLSFDRVTNLVKWIFDTTMNLNG